MSSSRFLSALVAVSLAVVTAQARAADGSAGQADASPDREAGQQAAPEAENWTWFGMGFESRQDRFRREMDATVPGVGGSAGSSGTGSGQNGSQGGGK